MQNAESHHIQSVHENVTPNLMPEKVKIRENLSVRHHVKIISEPKLPIASSSHKSPVPFKTHMEKLLEQTDPIEEARKSEGSMEILRTNMAGREAKLMALDNR